MKLAGTLRTGGPDQRAALYAALGDLGARSAGDPAAEAGLPKSAEERFALAVEWSRFDPRLLHVVVDLLARRSDAFDPVRLRAALRAIPSPAAAGVVVEFASKLPGDDARTHLHSWLVEGLTPAPTQLFFVGLYAPGGKLMRLVTERPYAEFERWGYLGREEPFFKDVVVPGPRHSYSARVRRLVLRDLLASGRWVRLGEYLDAVDRGVSRQRAGADVEAVAGLERTGRGRGARFRLRRGRAH